MTKLDKFLPRDTQPLIPILKAEKEESTEGSFFCARFTPLGKYELEILKNFVETITTEYVISRELSKKDKEHFHVLLHTEKYEFDLRDSIRAFLKIHFPEPPRRGDANKQYNLQECIDEEHALIYLLKDKGTTLVGTGINLDALESRRNKSYQKYSKEEFAKELQEIKDKFKELKWTLAEMMIAIVRLKGKYRQPINMNYIYQLCLSCEIHNNPNHADEYVQNFLSRLL